MNHYAQNNALEHNKALDSFKQSYVKLPASLQIKPSHGAYIKFKHYSSEGLSGILAGMMIFLPALCVILYMSY